MASRFMSFVLLAACLWVGVEIYTQGSARAFGGVFAGIGPAGGTPRADKTPIERIEGSVTGSRDRQLGRLEYQLEGSSVGLQDRGANRQDR